MSDETMNGRFTERYEDGDFTIEAVAHLTNMNVHIQFSSPEYEGEFSFDNFLGLNLAEAKLHPALVAQFIEKAIGDGEVKYHFERRSDALVDRSKRRSTRRSGGRR